MIGPVLPPATTFAEGQRSLYGLLAAAAGIFAGVAACALIAILVWGGWPSSLYGQIITILGCALGGFIAAMLAVIIGLLAGGPVGRFKADAEIAGNKVSFETEGTTVAPQVTTTTTVTPTTGGSDGVAQTRP